VGYVVEGEPDEVVSVTKLMADGRTCVPARIIRRLGLKKDSSYIKWVISKGKVRVEPSIG
jgi:bifunctional DNA-binding transcriptional regulator/antitoxin component of YhaV-PrlF toxin-antitoxin module